jgi:hypothetical protein
MKRDKGGLTTGIFRDGKPPRHFAPRSNTGKTGAKPRDIPSYEAHRAVSESRSRFGFGIGYEA